LTDWGVRFLQTSKPRMLRIFQREHPEILTQRAQPPVDLSVADIQWQIEAVRLEIAQWSLTMESV